MDDINLGSDLNFEFSPKKAAEAKEMVILPKYNFLASLKSNKYLPSP
jgi:hypothetical protein